jgi:hypothetical protein
MKKVMTRKKRMRRKVKITMKLLKMMIIAVLMGIILI